MYWYPSVQQLAQTGHAFIGMAVVLAVVLYGRPAWWGVLGVIGWATVKEFTFDLIVEGDTLVNSVIDWAFYLLGAGVAWVYVRWLGKP